MNLEKCPICGKAPQAWRETPAHGSKELFWRGCKKDGKLVGGDTQTVADYNWDRLVHRLKYELHSGYAI